MISRVLALSIQHRWLVVLLSLGAVALGIWSLIRLPIDAVPDITNKQVQVNTAALALSPAMMAAGSDGVRRNIRNTRIATMTITGMVAANLRRT